ncbi:hypothetical protein EYF80_045789 [Liparis tanakae]|uniref:Uncharacterized protein n=1 Tax=Liparis tanakae TaxID=230148 RepID=A0A4Z2FTH6_9TELE|nr:hypothetical protein EYF80_045789 [Liparis tanakae]
MPSSLPENRKLPHGVKLLEILSRSMTLSTLSLAWMSRQRPLGWSCSMLMGTPRRVKTDGVDEAAVTLELLQQLSVHVVHVEPPHAHQGVEAPRHHQVLGRGPVLSAVHEGRVGQHLLGRRLEPLHVPLSDGGESKRPFKSRVSNTRPAGRKRHARNSPHSSIRGGGQKAPIVSGPAEIVDDFEMAAEGRQRPTGGNLVH